VAASTKLQCIWSLAFSPGEAMTLSRRNALISGLALGAFGIVRRFDDQNIANARPNPLPPPEPNPLLTLDDYERAARLRVDPVAWEYIASGAADEITLRWNVEAWRSVPLIPHQLRDVSKVDVSLSLAGHRLSHPIILAPTACHKLAHPDGEVGTARGARAANAGMVLSSYSTIPIEEVARERPPLFWFQLYVQDRAYTEALIRRAVSAGATAIAVTVDTPTGGVRNRQQRSGFTFPQNLPHISGGRGEHALVWSDLDWIARIASVPIFLKGVLHPDDAERAIKWGAAGIMVSNHGGRNLDTATSTFDALAPITERVDGRIPVIVDGGIRRGTDIVKALANGASAVMIGRPYVHGLAVNGATGVESVVGILRTELEMAMALCGCKNLREIDPSIVGKLRRPQC
jgi:4-hydroxymandelate oxidase